jgi:hypothetical protein
MNEQMGVKRIPVVLGALVALASACSSSEPSKSDPADAGTSSGVDPGSCPAPYAECDGKPETVCEARLTDDIANCGACKKTCSAPAAHQVAACVAGACAPFTCEAGYVDCDHDASNGCEEPLATCGVTTLVASLSGPMGRGVDEGFVYYGSRGTAPAFADGILYKVPKNGGAPVVLATGLNLPLNLTLDDQRVYWSNGGTETALGTIAAIAKTGGAVTTLSGPLVRPGNPVLSGDRIFWTTREQPTGRILSAHKDGSDAAPTEIATGLANPSDLEVAGNTLVWATQGHDPAGKDALVERANLDGTGRTSLAKAIAAPSYQLGIAVDAVFVGSFVEGNVRRIPFDLSAPTILGSGLGQPHELIVDANTVFASTGSGHRILALAAGGVAPVIIADGQTFPSYMTMDADYVYWTDGPLTGSATVRKAKKPGK